MAKTAQLTATVSPPDATNKSVTWRSNAPDVASVSDSGLVTGLSAGTATITCTTVDGGKTATCEVSVTALLIDGITLNTASQTINKGGTFQLSATIDPADASIPGIAWSSSNTSIATVDSTGKVTAVAGGSATITAAATDGSNKKATCAITVNVPATGVSVSPTTLSLNF